MTCLLLPFIFWQIVFKHGGVEVETCFRDIFSQEVLLRHFSASGRTGSASGSFRAAVEFDEKVDAVSTVLDHFAINPFRGLLMSPQTCQILLI